MAPTRFIGQVSSSWLRQLSGHSRLGLRAAVVAGAYLTTSAVVLLSIYFLRRLAPSQEVQTVLGFFFLASLISGLDPATTKAAALADGALSLDPRPLLAASAVKALLAAPVLGIVWRFADPHAPWTLLLWLPLVCMAGFGATDLRSLLDLRGRHAAAIWLKQGSLAGGLALLAALVFSGLDPFWAIGISTLARLAPVAVLGWGLRPWDGATPGPLRILGQMRDVRWMEFSLASAIGALSGSTDRVLGLHFLPAAAWATYYLIYEAGSKFWFFPYLLGPIVFARRVAGAASAPFMRKAWRLTMGLGLAFLAGVAALLALPANLKAPIVGATPGLAILAFCAAVVLASFTQIRISELQARGQGRLATLIIGGGAVFSAIVFYIGVVTFGAPGLLVAWLVKSLAEFGAVMLGGRRGMDRKSLQL